MWPLRRCCTSCVGFVSVRRVSPGGSARVCEVNANWSPGSVWAGGESLALYPYLYRAAVDLHSAGRRPALDAPRRRKRETFKHLTGSACCRAVFIIWNTGMIDPQTSRKVRPTGHKQERSSHLPRMLAAGPGVNKSAHGNEMTSVQNASEHSNIFSLKIPQWKTSPLHRRQKKLKVHHICWLTVEAWPNALKQSKIL